MGVRNHKAVNNICLKTDNITKIYPGTSKPALNRFRIAVITGEIFGLLGPNGAGKTTAISVMSNILRPDEGRLEIFGIDPLNHPNKVKKMMGLVPQDIALYSSLTVFENLSFFGRMYGLTGKRLKSGIENALRLTGMDKAADLKVKTCSGGMKRRLNLAAGLIHDPRLIFLDEPTVGIDPQSRNTIIENLNHLKQQNITMIYTTHYMEEAQRLCDRVAIMDDGEIIVEGTPKALLEQHPDCENLGDLFLFLTGKQLRDQT